MAFTSLFTAVHNKGAALDNCWGFVDGSVRPIFRRKQHQRAVHNSHKRVHALKFQLVVTPNRLVATVNGLEKVGVITEPCLQYLGA